MARLRILHVAEAFGGGLLEMVRLVAQASVQAGHEVAVGYGLRPETPADPACALGAGVEAVPIGWAARGPGEQLAAARRLARLHRRWRPDLVHLHSSFAGVIGSVVLPRSTPVIFTPHAFASSLPGLSRGRRSAYRGFELLAVRRAHLVGAVSQSEAEIAIGLGARAVDVIENGIVELDGASVAAPRSAPPRTDALPAAIAIGRIVRQRRPEACARILGAIRDVADVTWVGGGGNTGAWGAGARASLEHSGVPMTGWLPRDEVMEALARARWYLHWTAWDGQPLSVLEAMARDTVVVASDIPPNRELLDGRQLCATEQQAIDLLRRLAVDPTLHASLLDAQRERRGRWSARRMCDRWLVVYQQLTSQPAQAEG